MNPLRTRSVLLITGLVALVASMVPVANASAASAAAQLVPGLESLNQGSNANVSSISCSSGGNCAAGGYYQDGSGNNQAFVANEVSGVWQGAQEVAKTHNTGGNAEVNSVSCSSDGNCVAGGYYVDNSGDHQAFVVDEVSGVWQGAQKVAGNLNGGGSAAVSSVSCSSDGNCAAGGYYLDGSFERQAFVADEVNGAWQGAQEVAKTHNIGGSAAVNSVSCPSAGNCVAGGSYVDNSFNYQAFVANEVNGFWGSAQMVAGTLNTGGGAAVNSVSCSSDGNCEAGGAYAANSLLQSFSVTESAGTWGSASSVPGLSSLTTGVNQGSQLNAVSCPTNGTCAAGGVVGNVQEGGVVGQAWVLGSQSTQVAGPLDVTAVRGVSWLRATWSASPGVRGYQCTLLTGIGAPSSFVERTTTSSCTFLGLDRTTAYGVEVAALAATER